MLLEQEGPVHVKAEEFRSRVELTLPREGDDTLVANEESHDAAEKKVTTVLSLMSISLLRRQDSMCVTASWTLRWAVSLLWSLAQIVRSSAKIQFSTSFGMSSNTELM